VPADVRLGGFWTFRTRRPPRLLLAPGPRLTSASAPGWRTWPPSRRTRPWPGHGPPGLDCELVFCQAPSRDRGWAIERLTRPLAAPAPASLELSRPGQMGRPPYLAVLDLGGAWSGSAARESGRARSPVPHRAGWRTAPAAGLSWSPRTSRTPPFCGSAVPSVRVYSQAGPAGAVVDQSGGSDGRGYPAPKGLDPGEAILTRGASRRWRSHPRHAHGGQSRARGPIVCSGGGPASWS
jgi:hypothetical protein